MQEFSLNPQALSQQTEYMVEISNSINKVRNMIVGVNHGLFLCGLSDIDDNINE